jgi:O-antigen/teichoic acid export membrane protein
VAEAPTLQIGPVALHGRGKLAVDIASTFGARFAGVPLALVSSILLARTLHPAGKGVYATVNTVGDLSLVLGTLGISTAAVYYLAQPSESLERTRATVLGLCLLIGIVVTVGLVVAAGIAGFAGGSSGTGWAFVAVAPVGIISLGRAALESFFRAQHQIRAINVAAVISSVAFLAFLVVAQLDHEMSASMAVALRVGSVAVAVATLLVAARSGRLAIPRPRLHGPTVRLLLGYGVPYAAYSIVQNFSNRFDYILLRLFDSSRVVGVYSIAVGQGELLWILPTAVGFVLFPRVAALARSDPERAAVETAVLLRWSVLLTTVAAAAVAVVAAPLTRIVYGSAFAAAVTPLRILLVGIVASSFLQVLSSLLLGSGRLRLLIQTTAVGFGLNLGLNLVLIPRFGMNGAAVSSAISYTITGVLLTLVARKHMPALRRQSMLPLPRAIAADVRRFGDRAARGGSS